MVGSVPRRWSRPLAVALLVASVIAGAGPRAVASPAVTEFALPTGSIPRGIAAGPDGALWFTALGSASIGRITTDGALRLFPLTDATEDPGAIAAGPDGAMWFTEQSANRIGRIARDGSVSEYVPLTDVAGPTGIVTGPDGALWFTERNAHQIGRLALDGSMSEFPTPTAVSGPMDITVGPDGALWFTEQRASKIGRISTDGSITEFPLPQTGALPTGIAAGPDGALWFTERATNLIGRITVTGDVTTFAVPTAGAEPNGIAAGTDGALWFTEPKTDKLGRLTTAGAFTEVSLPNVGSSPFAVTAGPDQAVWFTEGAGDRVGRFGEPPVPPDTTAPTVTLTTPADGGVYLEGQRVLADYGCADEPGGSGLASCAGPVAPGAPIDTSLGAHRFAVQAVDGAGNTGSAANGYLAFASIDGTLLGGSARAGAWVTLTLGMRLSGRAANPLGAAVTQPVDCASGAPLGVATPASLNLRVSVRGELVLRWDTDRAWSGQCRSLVLSFSAPGWTGVDGRFGPVAFAA